jgi:hypothetical protein
MGSKYRVIQTCFLGLSLILFLTTYSHYLYMLANTKMNNAEQRLRNYWPLLFLLTVIFAFERIQKTYYQTLFLLTCWSAIFITIIVILLTNHGYITNPYYMLGIIDLGTLIATLMILISGGRHGAFNE